jgi:TatD DNase family protein
MSFLVDTHAHIYLDEFRDDRAEMMQRAHEKGIGRIYMPNVDHTSIDGMLELEAQYPERCFAMMGLHPCYIKADFQKELYLVEEWLSKRKFAAVGEIGTDLYWDKTFWEQQKEAFRIQVNLAKKYSLPVVIHCRESIDETIALVEELRDESLTGIFHCFSGNADQAKRIISMNFYLGIGGVATFKKGGLDLVLPEVSLDRLVLETDSPYLAPVPYRGKRNEPAYIALVATRVAELMRISEQEVIRTTTANALKIFCEYESPVQ